MKTAAIFIRYNLGYDFFIIVVQLNLLKLHMQLLQRQSRLFYILRVYKISMCDYKLRIPNFFKNVESGYHINQN